MSLVKALAKFLVAMVVVMNSLTAEAGEPKQLRVLSYNIHHGRGMDNKVDLARIAKVITDSKADLVALQEVDHKTRRTNGVDQTAELSKLTGLEGRFAKAIDFEGGEYGQALLSRWPIKDVDIHLLPGEPDREKRIIAIGKLDIDGRRLRFCTTHLHHISAEFRLRQAEAINEKLVDSDKEAEKNDLTIVAGDLNAEPDSMPIAELLKHWTLAKSNAPLLTFSATDPKKQIDYVLYRPESAVKTVSIEVINEPLASDHRPVLAILEIR